VLVGVGVGVGEAPLGAGAADGGPEDGPADDGPDDAAAVALGLVDSDGAGVVATPLARPVHPATRTTAISVPSPRHQDVFTVVQRIRRSSPFTDLP
jgi:hypothetical protein